MFGSMEMLIVITSIRGQYIDEACTNRGQH